MAVKDPESMARAVVEACADCDTCRYLMDDTPCLVFPELYRLYDKQAEHGPGITSRELRNLVDLCNFCALCPCPDVRSDLMRAKHAFVRRDGLKPTIRLLEDVERVAGLCGAYPGLANRLFQGVRTGGLLKRLVGIHAERKLPVFPPEYFPTWVKRQGLHVRHGEKRRRVAYFAGCTGQYLFPEVPRAVVEVLQHNDVEVTYPEQKCCGMPSLLEGDGPQTLEFAAFNVERLVEAVEAGYDIVCSCPTCGYMLKTVISDGARYAMEYRELGGSHASSVNQGALSKRSTMCAAGPEVSVMLKRSLLEGRLRDDGYFSSIDARKRMLISGHTYDLGEYLSDLRQSGEINPELGPVAAHMAYYPPCHQREQNIGQPYAELLRMVPQISLETIEGVFTCCGMAGIMGFKRDFHQVSVAMGSHLMERIKTVHPERLVTDCLSCRLQFHQLLPYPVSHPVEILREAYANAAVTKVGARQRVPTVGVDDA
jgi:glycerol-3-phosphate dehydrogenase subunit C